MTASDALTIWLLPSAFAPHRGGIELTTGEIARELARAGHRVLVVTNRHPLELAANEDVAGTPVVRIAFGARRRSPSGAARFLRDRRAARRAIDRLVPRPDIVHVHGVSSQADFALHAHRASRAPLVVTTHGEITADAHGLYAGEGHARTTLREVLATAAAVTVPARRVATDAARVGLALPPDCRVIPNGIDLDEWSAVPPPPPIGHVVGAWGRPSPEKGFDRLTEAWPLVREQLPDAELWLAGLPAADARVRSGDAVEGIRYLAAAAQDEIRTYLVDTRVVVVPSRAEAFGLVALEALAAGRRVVYSGDTGMADTIGPWGLAVDADDAAALAQGIVSALAETDRPRPPADFFPSWADVTARYVDVYREVLATSRTTSSQA